MGKLEVVLDDANPVKRPVVEEEEALDAQLAVFSKEDKEVARLERIQDKREALDARKAGYVSPEAFEEAKEAWKQECEEWTEEATKKEEGFDAREKLIETANETLVADRATFEAEKQTEHDALTQREQAIAPQEKALAERETALNTREQALNERERGIDAVVEKRVKDETKKERGAFKEKEKALTGRRKAVVGQERAIRSCVESIKAGVNDWLTFWEQEYGKVDRDMRHVWRMYETIAEAFPQLKRATFAHLELNASHFSTDKGNMGALFQSTLNTLTAKLTAYVDATESSTMALTTTDTEENKQKGGNGNVET